VAVAARKDVEASGASAELKVPAITERPIAIFATCGKETATVSTEAAANFFTVTLRLKTLRPRRTGDSTRKSIAVLSVSFAHRPRPHRLRTPPTAQAIEVDLPQSLEAVGGASAGECSQSTILPHWSVATQCTICSSAVVLPEGCSPRE
jgi:hypothetical protein